MRRKKFSRFKSLFKAGGAALTAVALLLTLGGLAMAQQTQTLLPGSQIPKFRDPLPLPPQITVLNAAKTPKYRIFMMEFDAQVLPEPKPLLGFAGYPKTKVWGYRTTKDILDTNRQTYVGPVVVAQRGIPVQAIYRNDLRFQTSLLQPLIPFDLTLDWANPKNIVCQTDAAGNVIPTTPPNDPGCYSLPSYAGPGHPLPAAPHIHGGEVEPAADGGPDEWFTLNGKFQGPGASPYVPVNPAFPKTTGGTKLNYPNSQEPSTIWFHDHALGITRLNVYAGMAGMYIINDPAREPVGLPSGAYDIPLVIQDRSFDTNGQLFYNLASNPQPNPTVHPFWIPEFIGDSIVVNGKTWPYLDVEPRKYRFRILNGSQARFYKLFFSDGRPFRVIATDGGYLKGPARTNRLLIAPGERYEVVVDFAGATVGSRIILRNVAPTPFPGGAPVTPATTDRIMQFRVVAPKGIDNSVVPPSLRPDYVNLRGGVRPAGMIKRQLTLNENIGPGGPLGLMLNNSNYNQVVSGFTARETELPAVGDTEIWEIINISADAHPIHTHLVQFQLLSRQNIDTAGYLLDYGAPVPGSGPPFPYLTRNADGAIGGNPPLRAVPSRVIGLPKAPASYELGWKDTVIAMPNQVTRFAVRWAPQDAPTTGVACPGGNVPLAAKPCVPQVGSNLYPFDPTQLAGGVVGYVWHCHILEHEDNDMMRSYIVGPTRQVVK